MPSPESQGGRVTSQSYSFTPSNEQYYAQAYNNALRQNKRNYANILTGYRQAQRRAINTQNQITGGYQRLGDSVMDRLKDAGLSEQQEINDRYAMERGRQAQGLTNAGLGNTTVSSSVMRGLTLDQQKAGIDLMGQVANLQAGYQTRIGMGGLESQSRGLGISTDLASRYLGALASYQTPYPSLPNMGGTSTSTSYGYPNTGGGGTSISGLGGGGMSLPRQSATGAGYYDYGATQGQPYYMESGGGYGGGGGGGGYGQSYQLDTMDWGNVA